MKVTINIPNENLKQALALLVVQFPEVCDIIPELQKTESAEVTEDDIKEIGVLEDDAWKQLMVALAMMGYGVAMKKFDSETKEPQP